ncbi:CocE/NonD family hydrolase [Kribbella sp. NPDC056861]|uniref:CocE/NonD family hydrolase n=1 Tax=Kribbella sp. NPDC056861 TaxID=3154857 RepID=UPI0034329262
MEGTQTVAAYDYDNVIREKIEVQVPTDGDADGVPDRVTIDVIRPGEAAEAGIKVPVIMQASPYYGAFYSPSEFDGKGVRQVYGGVLDNYFVPRGYAVVFADLAGTFRATGCDDVGAQREIAGTKAVVDWLNGRAKGFTTAGAPATANWSTGQTGMIGVSWNGTIANAVASTGVEGLKTIVPIAAISSWYDYTRSDGIANDGHIGYLHNFVNNKKSPNCNAQTAVLEEQSDSATGNYSKWWDPRNYNLNAKKVKASVYVVHGLADENVKTRQFGQWWDQLAANNVPRKIFLHRDQHIDPIDFGQMWLDRLHPWFDYWLQGLQNGVMDTPMATVQQDDGTFTEESTWPAAAARQTRLRLGTGSPLSITSSGQPTNDLTAVNPTSADSGQALFLSEILPEQTRLSGTASISLKFKADKPATGIQVRLVDYGTAARYSGRDYEVDQVCYGDGDNSDTGCEDHTENALTTSDAAVVTHNNADAGHWRTPYRREKLVPGRWYDLRIKLNTDDVTFAAGHRIGVAVTAEPDLNASNPETDPTDIWGSAERRPSGPVTVTVDPLRSFLTAPLSGGIPTLRPETDDRPAQTRELAGSDRTARPAAPTKSAPFRLAQPEPEKDPRKLMQEFIEASK